MLRRSLWLAKNLKESSTFNLKARPERGQTWSCGTAFCTRLIRCQFPQAPLIRKERPQALDACLCWRVEIEGGPKYFVEYEVLAVMASSADAARQSETTTECISFFWRNKSSSVRIHYIGHRRSTRRAYCKKNTITNSIIS